MKLGLIKGATTATGAARIWVFHLKAFTGETVVEIHLAPVQILQAGRIYEKIHPVTLQYLVLILLFIKGHPILKARTTTGLHENTKELALTCFLGLKCANLADSTVC